MIDLKKTLFGVFSNDNQYGHQYGDKIILIQKDITTCKQTADLWSKIFRLIFIVYAKLNNLATQNGDKYVYLSKRDQMEQMADKSNPKKRELSSLTLKKQKNIYPDIFWIFLDGCYSTSIKNPIFLWSDSRINIQKNQYFFS